MMGISHLYTTLEPLAFCDILEGESIVIDGPALAYHALHLCRVNGVTQPAYGLLGRVAILWLDKISLHNIEIKIYFDGYLPASKLDVRVARMMKSAANLNNIYGTHPKGCPAAVLVPKDRDIVMDIFPSNFKKPKSTRLLDPPFLVPAVLNALRENRRYSRVTYLVPGEADDFCAAHALDYGGIVITSDSDLLVHNLGNGRVAFFKDLQSEYGSKIRFLNFSPSMIFEKLGLKYPEKSLQLAYERKMSPQATLSQIVKRCLAPAPKEYEYVEFQKQYMAFGETTWLERTGFNISSLQNLDPRISEMILEFYSRTEVTACENPIRMFLPPLMECPEFRSAWDPFTPIRQLAYSIVKLHLPHQIEMPSIQEFRRVTSLSYTGRQVALVSQHSASQFLDNILSCAQELQETFSVGDDDFWISLSLALDRIESRKQNRQPLAQAMTSLLEPPAAGRKENMESVPWAEVHITAKLQAALYSFRMLYQVLNSLSSLHLAKVHSGSSTLCDLLSQLPPMGRYPSIATITQTGGKLRQFGLLKPLEDDFTEQDIPQETNRGDSSSQTPPSQLSQLANQRIGTADNIFNFLPSE